MTPFLLGSPSRFDTSTEAWYVDGPSRIVNIRPVSNANGTGVRPAIEVSKSNIEY